MFRAILLYTKGIIRDARARRFTMFWIMLTALVMLCGGSMLFSDKWARENPWLYLAYWLVCAWLTIAGMLLALLDILIIRATHRAARRALEHDVLKRRSNSEDK